MKEKIIVVPTINKLAITLAYHNKSSFNVRFLTSVELAREALLRNGKMSEKEFVSRSDEPVYYKQIVDSIDYFKTTKLADIKNINQTINAIRQLVFDNEEEIKEKLQQGIFKEKNNALYEVYKKYNDRLNNENKIDTIGLIRNAISNCIDVEINTLKEFELQPLDYRLINSISNDVKQISIFDLFNLDKKNINITAYKNCYGSSNEVGNIIDDIFTNNNLDQCVVACGDYQTYSQIFYDYACKYKIDISFENGLSLINSYPGKLLKQYYYWISDGNFGWLPFNDLIHSPYFNFELFDSLVISNNEKEFDHNKFYEKLAKLRLTNNLDINKQRILDYKKSISREDINDNYKLEKYIDGFEIIAKELALPIEEFLNKYYVARKQNEFEIKFDEAAITTIINEIKSIHNIGLTITDDVIETILKKPVYRQGNKPGKLHITTIENALSSLRNTLYVCGLSSTIYPGSPKENPLLLDADLEIFKNEQLTSKGKIKQKREALFNLIDLASSLNNKIYLSYPGLNVSELKNNNASSLLYEIYKRENGDDKSLDDFKKEIKTIQYFEPKLSKTIAIGEAYNKSKNIVYNALNKSNNNNASLDIGKYSPSALNTFFNCKKQFFYQNLLKINVQDDYNPYEVISASEQGTLAHALMEYLADHRMPKEDFLKLSDEVFDEYMKISVPLVKESIQKAKEEFVEMLSNGFDMDEANPRELDFKEEDQDVVHEQTGIIIHGYPDRVEKTKEGKAVIVDFKTERDKNAHLKDDINTCLQVLIYAYIVENKMSRQIDHCEYRMLRFDKNNIVTCKYDKEMKDLLNQKLIEFKDAIDSGDFSIEPMTIDEEKEKCKYCKYGAICGKVVIDE